MANLLVTHADQPIGRRVVKTLLHDEDVGTILALGDAPTPHCFDRFAAGSNPRLFYARLDLAKHRPVSNFFHSSQFREAKIDSVIHIPRHGATTAESAPVIAGVPERTAETRLVLRQCLQAASVRSLIAVGSAFVYRLAPGNANRLDEESELDFDPELPSEIRSWIDCDMIFHGEVHNDRLRVVLLRVPTVVAEGGYVYFNPSLSGRPGLRVRRVGFDPICALVSDKDVARAIQAALRARGSGIYNIAGTEVVPLSMLARWTQRWSIPVPGTLLGWVASGARFLGARGMENSAAGMHLSYGFTLDTARAERDLAFHPNYRIGLARGGDGAIRVETSSL